MGTDRSATPDSSSSSPPATSSPTSSPPPSPRVLPSERPTLTTKSLPNSKNRKYDKTVPWPNLQGRFNPSKSLYTGSNAAAEKEESDTDATAFDDSAAEESDTDSDQSSFEAWLNSADSTASQPKNGYPANHATGRPAGVKPKDIFSIPPETRLEIFSHILKEDGPIKLQMKRRGYRQHIIRVGSRRELGVALIDPVLDRFMAPIPTRAAVLSVCKSIYAEAAAVLYGENTFLFESTTVLANFMAHIDGSTASLIKHIAIASYIVNTAKDAGTQLIKASNLRTLSIPHWEFCALRYGAGKCKVNAGKLLKDFGKILGPLKASYEKQNVKADVLDVFVLEQDHGCEEWHGPNDDEKAEACNQRKQKELRDAAAKYLGSEGDDAAEDGKPADANASVN